MRRSPLEEGKRWLELERLCADAARFHPEFRERARQWSILDGYYVPPAILTACLTASPRASSGRGRPGTRCGWLARSSTTRAAGSKE